MSACICIFFFWQINKLKLITVDHRDTTWPTWHWANAECPLPLKSLRHIFNLEFHNIFIVRRCEGDKNCNTGQKNPRTKRTGCRFNDERTMYHHHLYIHFHELSLQSVIFFTICITSNSQNQDVSELLSFAIVLSTDVRPTTGQSKRQRIY